MPKSVFLLTSLFVFLMLPKSNAQSCCPDKSLADSPIGTEYGLGVGPDRSCNPEWLACGFRKFGRSEANAGATTFLYCEKTSQVQYCGDKEQPKKDEANSDEPPANDLEAACKSEMANMETSCNANRDPEISKVMGAVKKYSAELISNAAAACSGLASLGAGAIGAITAYEATCKLNVENCVSTCDPKKATDLVTRDKLANYQKECKSVSKRTNPDLIAAANAMSSASNSTCGNLLDQIGSKGLLTGKDLSDCNQNPSNPVCVCMKNPSACANLKTGGLSTPDSSLIGGAPESSLGTGGDLSKMPYLPDELSGAPDGKGNFQGVNQVPGGRGGGGGGLGDSGGPNGKGKGAGGRQALEANLYKGTVGGGAGAFGSGGSKGSGGYGGGSGSVNGASYAANGSGRPDFSKFYPNMKYDPGRGIASGRSGLDGITGPTTNLFVKVNNQFKSQGGTAFLP